MSRWKGAWPELAVMAAATALGLWTVSVSLADPYDVVPRTAFSAGHLLAPAVARAQVQTTGWLHTFTPLLGWPEGAAVRPLLWPMLLLALVVEPPLALTLTFALMPLFNAVCGVVLGRALGLDRWGCATLAGLCAWSPWVRETLTNGQLEQACIGGIALVWAIALRLRSALGALVLLPTVAALGLAAPHVALAAAGGLAGLAIARPGQRIVYWIVVLGSTAAGLLVAHAYHAPNFEDGVQLYWPKGSPGHPTNLPGLPEVVSLGTLFLPPGPPTSPSEVLHINYLGVPVLIAAGLGLWRGGPMLRGLGVVAVLLVLLAFGGSIGPFPGPYRLVELVAPTVKDSSSPYRMVAGALVALSAGAAFGARGPAGLALVAVAWIETSLVATRPLPYPPMLFPRDAEVETFESGTGPILDLPLVGGKCPASAYHYTLEALRRKRPTPVLTSAPGVYPTVNGLNRNLLHAWQMRPCGPPLERLFHDLKFGGVVVHHHDPSCPMPPSLEACLEDAYGPGEDDGVTRWWDPLPPLSPEAAALPDTLFRPRRGTSRE